MSIFDPATVRITSKHDSANQRNLRIQCRVQPIKRKGEEVSNRNYNGRNPTLPEITGNGILGPEDRISNSFTKIYCQSIIGRQKRVCQKDSIYLPRLLVSRFLRILYVCFFNLRSPFFFFCTRHSCLALTKSIDEVDKNLERQREHGRQSRHRVNSKTEWGKQQLDCRDSAG